MVADRWSREDTVELRELLSVLRRHRDLHRSAQRLRRRTLTAFSGLSGVKEVRITPLSPLNAERQSRVNCEGWVGSRAIVRVCAGGRCP